MGNEQSDNNRNNASTPQQRQMSQAEVQRMLDQQRLQYERKLQEVVNKTKQEAAATPPTPQTISIERERAPYSYSGNTLQQNLAPAPPTPQPLYPNLNQPPAFPQFNNNNPFHPQVNNTRFHPQQPNDFVFVNNFGQTESYNRPAPSTPFRQPRGGCGQGPRPRSISRQRNESRERDVHDCPTCHVRFGLRIYQCDSGHSSCSECKNRGRVCGICRQALTNRRNFDLENHMAQIIMANKRRYSGKKRKSYGNLAKANEAKKQKREGQIHKDNTEESQLPSTSNTRVDKELEIVESQSEIIEATNECDQTMSLRDDISEVCSDELHDHDISTSAETKAACPHASEGCKLYIKISDMDTHIRECPFKEQECPLAAVFGTCRWRGKLSQISGHFDNMHPNGRQTDVDSEMSLTNVRNNSQEVHLVLLGTYNFLLHVKVSETDGKIYMGVQLIGTKTSASKWIYEIHVYNKNEKHRKYMYTDSCTSSSDNVEDIFKVGECAVLPVWYANSFVYNGAMNYKFFIKKTEEGKKDFAKNRGRGRKH